MRYPEIVPLALLFAGFKIKSQHTKPENGNACFFLLFSDKKSNSRQATPGMVMPAFFF
jgi:hypothetical protein